MAKITNRKLCNCARCFCVLGDETRMKILACLLRKHPASVGEIAKKLGLSLSTTSHSLAKLLDQRLVKKEKKGRTVFYSYTNHPMTKLVRQAFSL